MIRAVTWPVACLGIGAFSITGWALITATPWSVLIAFVCFIAAGWIDND